MATRKWIAGAVGLSWTSIMTTELNALASGSMVIATNQLDNSTNLDQYCDFAFQGGGSTTPTGVPYLGIYIYPLNQDNSTYGDQQSGANAPGASYFAGNISLRAAAATQTGTLIGYGTIKMPPGKWKPVLYNLSGVALAATSNILYYRTYNDSIA